MLRIPVASFLLLPLLCFAANDTSTKSGFFEEYVLESPASGPAIVGVDDEDTVWVAMAKTGKLARFQNGRITTVELGADSRPVGLAVGRKSNGFAGYIWIAASYDNKLIRYEVASGAREEFKIEGDQSWPFNVAIGPDHKIWFTERAANRIGSFDPATKAFRHFDVPTAAAGPAGLAIDPKSGVVWFTESYADGLASLDPNTGKFAEFRMSDSSTGLTTGPAGLCIDSDGVLWFAKLEGQLGHLDPREGKIQTVAVPAGALRPAGIIATPSGLWAVALDGNLLLNYSPATAQFTTYPLPTGRPDAQPSVPPFAKTSRPFGIAADAQGNIWFSEQYAGKLGVLDAAAPRVQFRSPGPVVKTGLANVALDIYDRVSGVASVQYHVDGRAIQIAHSQLDLTGTPPGAHTIDAVVTDRAGFVTTAKLAFDFTPGPVAIFDSVYSLQPRTPKGQALKIQLLTESAELLKGDPRPRIRSIGDTLAANPQQFQGFSLASWSRLAGFVTAQGAKQIEIQITDKAPFFSPLQVTVERGSSVRWVYDPPSNGHSISHNLHRVKITSPEVQSPILRAGESFAYVFKEAGRFEIHDDYQKQAASAIEVKAAVASMAGGSSGSIR